MPRQCATCALPPTRRKQVDEALKFGVSVPAIAETHGIAVSSLYRHKANHIPTEEQADDWEPETVGARLADLADDIRRERLTAQASGQKNTALRAAAVELRVLEQISARYGVEAVDALDQFERAKTVARVLGRVMQKHPELAARLIPELERAGFDDLVQDLENHARKEIE